MNEPLPPPFTLSERQRRWDLTRSFMSQHDLEAVIVYGEHEDAGAAPYPLDHWFTNDRPGSTVVFLKNGEPLELVPFLNFFADHMEGLANGDVIWIPASNIRAVRDAERLIQVLKELDLENSTIGVFGLGPAVPWHPEGLVPFTLWEKIVTRLPRATFKPVGHEFLPLLLQLSDEELSQVRYAASIGESMAKAMVEAIKVGAPDEVYAAGVNMAARKGTFVPMIHLNTGPNAVIWGPPRWAWRAQVPRVMKAGDLVASEIFCLCGMRQTQHQLAAIIGPVPEDLERAASVARTCYEADLRALQPDALFGDVAQAILKPVQDAGGWTKGPQAHSLNPLAALCGFQSPSHIAGNGYSEVEGMPTILADMRLKPGMTFAFEPSCGFGKHGITLGGTVVVGQDGAIELNPFTARLHRIQ